MVEVLVRCSCGWTVGGPPIRHPGLDDLALAGSVEDMVQHWRQGHRVQCLASVRAAVRSLAKALARLQRAKRRDPQDGVEATAKRQADSFRRMGIKVETYDPFSDEWSEW